MFDTDYFYLASPYSKYENLDEAFSHACDASALLLTHKIPHYSPIVAGHNIKHLVDLDPRDHTHWTTQNTPMMHFACGIIILRVAGWQHSDGVLEEWKFFVEKQRQIEFMDPGTIPYYFTKYRSGQKKEKPRS